MVEVAAALIWQEDRFMICQRPAHKTRGLLWEFVGGKLEAGETGPDALIREVREELAIEIAVDGLYMDVIHTYPDMQVHLSLYHAHVVSGEPQLLEHADMQYIHPSEIDRYDFCPADVEILARIKQDYL